MGRIARYASREAANGAAGSRGEVHARQLQASSSAAERRGQSDSEECKGGPAAKARLPPPPLPLQARARAGQPKLSNPPPSRAGPLTEGAGALQGAPMGPGAGAHVVSSALEASPGRQGHVSWRLLATSAPRRQWPEISSLGATNQ
jgi:hypothetical protein